MVSKPIISPLKAQQLRDQEAKRLVNFGIDAERAQETAEAMIRNHYEVREQVKK